MDGDSLDMAWIGVRLHGVDAPELNQTCAREGQSWAGGKEASAKLAQLVNGAELQCEQRDVDDYDRIVARCTARQVDLGQAMVEAGLAVALPQFSDRYLGAEARAKTLKLGIWASDFQQPADYRAANPRAHRPKHASVMRQPMASPGSRPRSWCNFRCRRWCIPGWGMPPPGMRRRWWPPGSSLWWSLHTSTVTKRSSR